MGAASDEPWVHRLLDVGRVLTTELDQRIVLDRVLEAAREITGARYAALGILNERHSGLEQFLTSGIDEDTRRAIGDLPRGRGVLGTLIEHPQPLRLGDVGQHPSSYGFPAGHPPMRSFLGVPVVIRGEVWGNLYLTEKSDGQFTETDEEAAVVLADWAAIAIGNAKLYESSERRRQEAEKAFRGLEATRDVAVAIGGEIALEHVLELIVKRGRALVGARSLVIMLREGQELVVHASAGHVEQASGVRLSIAESTSGQVLERRHPERIADVGSRLRIDAREFGVSDPQTGLLVPMLYRGEGLGILAAFDRGPEREMFSEDDEQLLRTFAASAATAVALAQSVQDDRLRSSLAAAEAERGRWARELHDETLQGLGGLQVLLSSALRRGDPGRSEQAMREAVEHIKREIENLRAIITELRPAALDELGLQTAIEALLDRHREQSGFQIEDELVLPGPATGTERLDSELESVVYRLVQEALTNVAKHARASTVRVVVEASDGQVLLEVRDDGAGFDTEAVGSGFGLDGMRERVSLAGGTLSISSGGQGTLVTASLPTDARDEHPSAATRRAS
ncbi:MAG TPA: GAF domain-containing sensor histidine kinase [Solirubrobacteraceae bacterium]|jgi:signal transduction histidine kinase|nr:GAF domain-containing sensor histidine kinase [Solirubrobacteraceae bacterium]